MLKVNLSLAFPKIGFQKGKRIESISVPKEENLTLGVHIGSKYKKSHLSGTINEIFL